MKLNERIFLLKMMNYWINYNSIWNKFNNAIIKKEIDSEPVYNEKI